MVKSKLLLMIHDSLVFLLHRDEVKLIFDLVKKNMNYSNYSIHDR